MTKPRARDLGIRIGTMEPGPLNAITDVAGVRVGHRTLISGEGRLVVGRGPVRTGVTVIQPHDGNIWTEPLYAAPHRLNGNGEMTGLEWMRESGLLTSPVAITNTHSVGVVRDALIEHDIHTRGAEVLSWGLPVVAETWDGRLNDINGFHVTRNHVFEALDSAAGGPVAEGSVGGGTGMVSFGFKAGIGTASRRVPVGDQGGARHDYTLGVLVQSNFGRRERLTVGGVPVGRTLTAQRIPLPDEPPRSSETGSIIAIAATDAPLLPHQCARVAQRIGLGIGRIGGAGGNFSGDIFLCFATGNRGLNASVVTPTARLTAIVETLDDGRLDHLFHAVIEATEEAILNAMLAADTMTGRDDVTAHALPPEELVSILEAGWSPISR
ncbi:P1 family peptidase [soil metagenome]